MAEELELEVLIKNLDDGCVRVSLGGLSTTCSSHHLVPDKIEQLKRALALDAERSERRKKPFSPSKRRSQR